MNRVAETFASVTNLYPPGCELCRRGVYNGAGTYPEFRTQTVAEHLGFKRSTVGGPLNLQPMFIRSGDELNGAVWI
jgi:hypothetical protein